MRTESVFFNSDIAHTVKQLIPVIVSALEYLAWNNKWHSFFNNSFSLCTYVPPIKALLPCVSTNEYFPSKLEIRACLEKSDMYVSAAQRGILFSSNSFNSLHSW